MGLLSKILGAAGVDRKLEQAVKKAVDSAVKNAVGAAPASRPGAPVQARTQAAPAAGESGFSWGPAMPAEECQFNYPGSYGDYFAHVFREDFPAYAVTREEAGRRTVFTFRSGPARALVVELLPESSETKKLRRECQAQGVPYLRFYYDHDGWWNTRAYVGDRVRKALLG